MSDKCLFCKEIEQYSGYNSVETEYVCSSCVQKIITGAEEDFVKALAKAKQFNQDQYRALLIFKKNLKECFEPPKEKKDGTRNKKFNNRRRTTRIVRNIKKRNV